MAILDIQTNFAGEIGVFPRLVRINTTDSYETVTATNYLKPSQENGYSFYDGDGVLATYISNSRPFTLLFRVQMDATSITLAPVSGEIVLPVTNGNLAVWDGVHGGLADSNIAADQVLQSSLVNPDVNGNLIYFQAACTAAAMAAAGSVQLIDSSASKQYTILVLASSSNGTNFSGGGGDRLGQVTDGTTVYSVIPAASLQTLANAGWGVTALPYPASAARHTPTVAGADLVMKYSGGTADYAAGSVVISGLAVRIA